MPFAKQRGQQQVDGFILPDDDCAQRGAQALHRPTDRIECRQVGGRVVHKIECNGRGGRDAGCVTPRFSFVDRSAWGRIEAWGQPLW